MKRLTLFLLCVALLPEGGAAADPLLDRAFAPPPEFAGKFGRYASPLTRYDGTRVTSPAEWPARRAEILARWHGEMGPWPELLARPRLEIEETTRREGVTQHRVRVEVAAGVLQHGYLLVPPGEGRRPAVFVPYYDPETSVGLPPPPGRPARPYEPNVRDFAWQLARRGYVTLAIGSPGGDAAKPALHGARCQPLSYLAYIAANCHTALAQCPQVDPERIGVIGQSYGGKWAMFASCFYEKYACGVWSDGGVVFDESRPSVNYQEPWYLGLDPAVTRARGTVTAERPRTGAYQRLVEGGHDLVEVMALMAPRPFLVSGGTEDPPSRWEALNHLVALNRFLGFERRVAMTNRATHAPTPESNELAYCFLAEVLRPDEVR